MVVIKFNAMMNEYQLESLSQMYKDQVERGIIILPAGAELVSLDEENAVEVINE